MTLILTAIGAAFAGSVGGWIGMRENKYLPLKKKLDENEKAFIQLTDAYAAGKTQYTELQTRCKDIEAANKKTLPDYKIISDARTALTNEFNIYKSEAEQKISALEAELKKLTEAVERHAEIETRFTKLSKEYATAIEETKILSATTANLVSEKQTLLSEYGNLRTEANQKYNALKAHLDKLQDPYAAYTDAEENENRQKIHLQVFSTEIFPDLSESVIVVQEESAHSIET